MDHSADLPALLTVDDGVPARDEPQGAGARSATIAAGLCPGIPASSRYWCAGRRSSLPGHCQLLCKNLQAVPNQASTIGLDRPIGETADPVFLASAVMCCHCLLPVTPEVASSSLVDPARPFQFKYFHSSGKHTDLRPERRRP
jgi:hypothetical protein